MPDKRFPGSVVTDLTIKFSHQGATAVDLIEGFSGKPKGMLLFVIASIILLRYSFSVCHQFFV